MVDRTLTAKVLDGVRVIAPDGTDLLKGSPAGAAVTGLLALHAPGWVPAGRLAEVLPRSSRRGAVYKTISRLRGRGVPIEESGGEYRLDVPPERIDVCRLVAAAERVRDGGTPDPAALELAEEWNGVPDGHVLAHCPSWGRVHDAHAALRAAVRTERRRQLLIVDDEHGDDLAAVLGAFDCVVVRRCEDFWAIGHERARRFDGAVVDLHLHAGSLDESGLAVVDHLARETTVPTMLISARAVGSATTLLNRYNLVDYVMKVRSGDGWNFSHIRERAVELFTGDGPEELLLERLEQQLVCLRRKARKRIELRRRSALADRDAAVGQMERDATAVQATVRRADLAAARADVTRFSATWCDPAP